MKKLKFSVYALALLELITSCNNNSSSNSDDPAESMKLVLPNRWNSYKISTLLFSKTALLCLLP